MSTSYDVVPYLGGAFAQTHPDRLATLARLFGMSPVPIERCRVLEIGCGDGGNLIPMAPRFPRSGFVGTHLPERPIPAGNGISAGPALTNISPPTLGLM